MSLMRTIASVAYLFFTCSDSDSKKKSTLSSQLILLINQVTLGTLRIQPPQHDAEFYLIYQSSVFSICIFVMKRGVIMPIHDHPDMTVFSKVIHGEMHAKTYQVLSESHEEKLDQCYCSDRESNNNNGNHDNNSNNNEMDFTIPQKSISFLNHQNISPSSSSNNNSNNNTCYHNLHHYQQEKQLHEKENDTINNKRPKKLLACKKHMDKIISSSNLDESILTISSDSPDNLHSFEAVSDFVILLDIIGPPYDDENGRHCTYFKEMPWNGFVNQHPNLTSPLLSQPLILNSSSLLVQSNQQLLQQQLVNQHLKTLKSKPSTHSIFLGSDTPNSASSNSSHSQDDLISVQGAVNNIHFSTAIPTTTTTTTTYTATTYDNISTFRRQTHTNHTNNSLNSHSFFINSEPLAHLNLLQQENSPSMSTRHHSNMTIPSSSHFTQPHVLDNLIVSNSNTSSIASISIDNVPLDNTIQSNPLLLDNAVHDDTNLNNDIPIVQQQHQQHDAMNINDVIESLCWLVETPDTHYHSWHREYLGDPVVLDNTPQ